MHLLAVMGLGAGEIIVLFVIILLIFGAGRLPKVGESLGKALKNFKGALKGEDEEEEKDSKPPKNP